MKTVAGKRATAPKNNGAPSAKSNGAESAVNLAVPTVAPAVTKTLLAKATALAETFQLAGSCKSHFDSVLGFGVGFGYSPSGDVLAHRQAILDRASVALAGIHTPRGRGLLEYAKAISVGIEELRGVDPKERKRLLGVWRRSANLFALFRETNGTFGAEAFNA